MQKSKRAFDKQTYYYSYGMSLPTPKPARRRKVLPISLSVLLILAVVIGYHLINTKRASATDLANHTAAATPKTSPPPNITPAALSTMAQKINAAIATQPNMQIAVSIVDLNTSSAYDYGVSAGYLAASTAKILTATLFLHQVETGNQSLDSTINGSSASYELQQMIEQSDNDAWYAFNDTLTHDALQAWANQLGLSSYDVSTNILSAHDVAHLLALLYQKQLLNSQDTNLLLSYMQNANETQYIESSVPAGVKVYHKAGWLDDRVHDAAIIDDGKHPYVLVIFSKVNSGSYDTTVGQALFHTITDASVTAFIK